MKVLVISACTAEKAYKPEELKPLDQLTWEDFRTNNRLERRTCELRNFRLPAAEMYTGPSHTPVKEGVEALRARHGPDIVDWYIVSPAYGLLHESEDIVPYDVDFKDIPADICLQDRGDCPSIHDAIERVMSRHNLVFFLLSRDYVRALELHLPFNVPKTVTHVFIAAQDSDDMIPFGRENVHIVRADVKLMNKILGANKHNLKGIVFKRLCDVVCRKGLQVFDEVSQYPQRIVRMVRDRNGRL